MVSQQSIPDCWEMPRHSHLSFLLGLFHGAELPSAFILLRLVWSFPSGNVFDVGGCDWCGQSSQPCFPPMCPLPVPAWLQGHSGTCSILHQAKGQAGEDGTLLAGLVPVLAALVLSPAVTLVGAAPVTSLSEGNQHSQLQEGGFDHRSELEL